MQQSLVCALFKDITFSNSGNKIFQSDYLKPCADSESFVRWSNFDAVFFKLYEGRKDPNTTISGPSLVRQRNAIEMAFRWRADDGPILNAG